jgi:hypothetical protein
VDSDGAHGRQLNADSAARFDFALGDGVAAARLSAIDQLTDPG